MKNQTLLGLACMAIGMSLIPVGDSIAKQLSMLTTYSSGFLAWSRFAIGLVFIGPIAWHFTRFKGLNRRFYIQQATRGALLATTITFIITAVSLSPLADVFGAFFIGPALAVVFSRVFLREQVSFLEGLSVVLGFIGVLMVVQPGFGMSAGLLWGLLAGVFYGGFLTATRWSANNGAAIAQLSAQLFFGFIFLLPLGGGELLTHGFMETPLLLAMGASSAAANYFSILALGKARPAFLAPVIYLQIVVATVIGLFFFEDKLGMLAGCGLVVIIITGLMRVPATFKSPHN